MIYIPGLCFGVFFAGGLAITGIPLYGMFRGGDFRSFGCIYVQYDAY